MDKLLTFAVAGAGKTTRLVSSLEDGKRSLILTYTTANIENLRRKVIDRYGFVPETVTISPYFSFIFSFCLRPFLSDKLSIEGINYKHVEQNFSTKTSVEHYMDGSNRIRSARIVKAIEVFGYERALVDRINKYYDCVYVDEVQDLASRDFDFLRILAQTRAHVELIGDFFQHTYDSSRDQNYRNNLFSDLTNYKRLLWDFGYSAHPVQLTHSYRCSKSLSEYITNTLGIKIDSHSERVTEVTYVEDEASGVELFRDPNIVKLFYKEHSQFGCFSRNWGECKGEDGYLDVCLVLNKSSEALYKKGRLHQSAPLTKNKLYVAMTRARGNLYLVSEDLVKKAKWTAT